MIKSILIIFYLLKTKKIIKMIYYNLKLKIK